MLETRAVHAFYGTAHILHGITLRVPPGERVAIVGRNGAGKSTLLKCIMNAGPRVAGEVVFGSEVLGAMPAYRRVRKGISFVPEDRRILTHITVRENLQMAARPIPRARQPVDADTMLQRFEMLAPLRDRPGGRLSGGQQQLLAVARALVARPTLLLLDEPTEGLAPVIVQSLAREVVRCCEESGMGLLLCEQNLWFARHCTDYVYVIESGHIVFDGSWTAFDEQPEIRSSYLSV